MVVFLYTFCNEHEDFSLKQCYDVDLTISKSQYGGFSTSVWFDAQPVNM